MFVANLQFLFLSEYPFLIQLQCISPWSNHLKSSSKSNTKSFDWDTQSFRTNLFPYNILTFLYFLILLNNRTICGVQPSEGPDDDLSWLVPLYGQQTAQGALTHLGPPPLVSGHSEHVMEYLQLGHILSLGNEGAHRLSKLTPWYWEPAAVDCLEVWLRYLRHILMNKIPYGNNWQRGCDHLGRGLCLVRGRHYSWAGVEPAPTLSLGWKISVSSQVVELCTPSESWT